MDAYTTIHTSEESGTYTKGLIGSGGVYGTVKENDRSRYNKLAISTGMVLEFKCAVVMELVETDSIGMQDEPEVGYDFTMMKFWNPTEDMRGKEVEATIERRGTPNVSTHLVRSMQWAGRYLDMGSAYEENIHEYYRFLTDAYYVVRMLGVDLPASYDSYAEQLEEHRKQFAEYYDEVTRLAGVQAKFVNKLMGFK
jgi:hypothetical protein